MKPVACGKKAYSSGTLSSPATSSAILFSKPSPLSLEKGRLAGSAHTRSAVRLTRSTRWAAAARGGSPAPNRARANSPALSRLLATETGLFRRIGRCWLFHPLGGATARQHAVRARPQVNVDVVDVAHDVGIIAQGRHLALFVRAHHFAATGDHQHEVLIAHGLERFQQTRRIGRAFAVGA